MRIAKGFTLSEILIAMLVLGIIVAASVPVIMNLTPNKNAIMMKKAYYATESIVHSLINDPNYYPDMTQNCIKEDGTLENSGTNDCYYGFDYADGTIEVPGVTNAVNSSYKLHCLFASKLNIKEDLNNVCNGTLNTVTTMDGMTWNIGGLSNGSADGHIHIDVDGINKGVNAYYGSNLKICSSETTWDTACNTELTARSKKHFDRIKITIDKEGRLSIPNDQEEFEKIISGETKLMGDDEGDD